MEYIVKNFSGLRYVKLVHSTDTPKLICRPSFVVPACVRVRVRVRAFAFCRRWQVWTVPAACVRTHTRAGTLLHRAPDADR